MSSPDQDHNFSPIIDSARLHAANIQKDISNAKDRIEHIRLTALAQEAQNLLIEIEKLAAGDPAATFNETQEVLDLPDFKSPYNPRA